METLVRVYQSRFERSQGREAAAREAAEAALARALDPVLENPFDEILARRALAPLVPVDEGLAPPGAGARAGGGDAQRAAGRPGALLAGGAVVRRARSLEASRALDAAEKAFQAARSPFWLTRVASLREDVLRQLGLQTRVEARCGASGLVVPQPEPGQVVEPQPRRAES